MNPVAHPVPRDAVDVARFAENFHAEHGVVPFAGGETVTGAPPAQTAPPPAAAPQAPAPAPLPTGVDPAVVDPAPQQPQAPAAAPAQGDPAAPQQQPQAPQPPDWMQPLVERMDQMGAPQAVDPIAAELGLVPPPVAPPQMPQQPPASPGPQQQMQQPGTPFPGAPQSQDQQMALVQQWIDERADARARAMVQEMVAPELEQMRQVRRQEDLEGLRADYEEFRDPVRGPQLVSQARQWAQKLGREDLAREPMFLELTLLAGRQMDALRQVAAQQQPAAVPQGQQPPAPGYPIEQPGPAAPAPAVTPEKAMSQRIVQAKGNGLSPLWT